MKLHIILPTNRRKYLARIVEDIYDCEPHGVDVRVHLMFQADQSHRLNVLFDKVNEGLDLIPDKDWLMFVSDEDKINPGLFKRITELARLNPDKECFFFSQEYQDLHQVDGKWVVEKKILRASPENLKPGECGGGQFVIKKSLVGMVRHDFINYFDGADGHFIRTVYLKNPHKFLFVDELMMSYDAYKWENYECQRETSGC